ncbi:LLM class flavin-dependent oxidoreductase [Lacisediminihabitans changchengi]|uniref:LLM class flavin-dependent oxidoreductase n=1 Tax=Lacisediminihabitans changchengi TaxID=2787634 RepID=A0A934SNS3_9MICO|nr:LLM class flavin-dependent oxidoreductase [Lacisediminihabitans changchengi]MBK4348821.1 LLM class flavin-dependent oxidoreductase [Lacisediminihabitans changchengi]
MKFGLMVDLGRTSPDISTEENLAQVTELVRVADAGGFDIVFTGEHHGHEMTIAPAPFVLLTYWSQLTTAVRLGTAVLCAPYWHPIRLAGEAALFDLISGGRLELGIGRGAYPYEFERMAGGIAPEVAREQLAELLPAVRGLWRGNYEHDGSLWKFPSTTSTPRPLNPDGPPLWVSARHPDVFEMAIRNHANLMVAPLSKGFEEVESLMDRRRDAIAKVDNGFAPQIMVLRDTYVGADDADPLVPVEYLRRGEGYFSNLFRTDGDVDNGWVSWVDPDAADADDDYQPENVLKNLAFGSAAQVRDELRRYDAAGTDVYLYNATWGLPFDLEVESLRRFCADVIPAFSGSAGS